MIWFQTIADSPDKAYRAVESKTAERLEDAATRSSVSQKEDG